MRKIFTLVFVFNVLMVGGQSTFITHNYKNDTIVLTTGAPIIRIPNCKGANIIYPPERKIIIRSHSKIIPNDFLLVIDGVTYPYENLQKINPVDIESVTIIKKETIRFSCHGPLSDLIIIITKSSKLRKFVIKDFLDGKTITGATVKFKSLKDKKDSFVVAANDSGFILTNKLKAGVEYEMDVSSVGFKNYSILFKNSWSFQEQTVFLERKASLLSEVVVQSYPLIKCPITFYCLIPGMTIYSTPNFKDSSSINYSLKIYPNPLPRGSNINIELTFNISETSSIRIFSLAGVLVHQQKISIGKWKTFSIASDKRWTAGAYIVQLLNETGKPVGQQKIILQ